jgi:cellulose synthase/poly-beta-1,6-N-acetylglucosamine synthase-like glycosyltransferase
MRDLFEDVRQIRCERRLGWIALVATILFFVGAEWHTVGVVRRAVGERDLAAASLAVLFALVLLTLLSGSVLYQMCRFGFLERVPVDGSDRLPGVRQLVRGDDAPSVLMLIPSYKEEPAVIRQAILSAMLQDHANRRVVLLIDDPPPSGGADSPLLEATRRLVDELDWEFDSPRRRTRQLHAALRDGLDRGEPVHRWRTELHDEIEATETWLEHLIETEGVGSHTDAHFVDRVLRVCSSDLRSMADALSADSSAEALLVCSGRLRALFDVELSRFERKQWVNLPHEANKAMNINAYLSLVGKAWAFDADEHDQLFLTTSVTERADLFVPDPAYVVTLDADSMLDPHYVVRLVGQLELTEHERVAVIQTPYSAVPGAPTSLERVAGATTDLQYIVHQGFTHWDATFWVGANAVLRMSAIRSIATADVERGWPIVRFVQDRTVIEDTESSIDLAASGWQLHNVPDRLSWSATPPDFGALVIQRRRWANGGLIIFPKLLRCRRHLSRATFLLRGHYLVSPAVSNLAVLLLVLGPFGAVFQTFWLPLCALPYFWIQHRDLQRLGYRRAEILRIWALNLLLVPVNLAGVSKSLQQAAIGAKTPFARTPKVENRTRIPRLYIAAPLAFAVSAVVSAWLHLRHGFGMDTAFAFIAVGLLLYAMYAFVGPRAVFDDLVRPEPTTDTEDSCEIPANPDVWSPS